MDKLKRGSLVSVKALLSRANIDALADGRYDISSLLHTCEIAVGHALDLLDNDFVGNVEQFTDTPQPEPVADNKPDWWRNAVIGGEMGGDDVDRLAAEISSTITQDEDDAMLDDESVEDVYTPEELAERCKLARDFIRDYWRNPNEPLTDLVNPSELEQAGLSAALGSGLLIMHGEENHVFYSLMPKGKRIWRELNKNVAE